MFINAFRGVFLLSYFHYFAYKYLAMSDSNKVLVNKKLLVLLRKLLKERETFRSNEKLLLELRKEMDKNPEFGTGWMTTKELFANYKIKWKTFNNWRRDGLKVKQDNPNSKILIKKSEVEKFLNKNKRNGR